MSLLERWWLKLADFNAVNGMTNGSLGDLMGNFDINIKDVKKSDQGQKITTDNIDEVVGQAYDKDIETSLLIKARPEWDLFPAPSRDTVYRMAASIDQYGLLHRVTVWEQTDGKYMILGGHTRYEAFRWLSENTHKPEYDKIPARVYRADQLTEDDAHRIFLVSNTDQRTLSASVITNAYMDLLKLEKEHSFYGSGIYSRTAAAKQADVSPTTFTLYLGFRKLIPELRDALDNNDLALWPAYSLAKLSEDMQRHFFTVHNGLCHGKKLSKDLGKAIQDCDTPQAMNAIIDEWFQRPQTYTYRISSHVKMSKDETALPLLVPKSMRQSVKAILIEHADLLGLDEAAQQRLVAALKSED